MRLSSFHLQTSPVLRASHLFARLREIEALGKWRPWARRPREALDPLTRRRRKTRPKKSATRTSMVGASGRSFGDSGISVGTSRLLNYVTRTKPKLASPKKDLRVVDFPGILGGTWLVPPRPPQTSTKKNNCQVLMSWCPVTPLSRFVKTSGLPLSSSKLKVGKLLYRT